MLRVRTTKVHKLELEVSRVVTAIAAAAGAGVVRFFFSDVARLTAAQDGTNALKENVCWLESTYSNVEPTLKSNSSSGISNPSSIHSLYIRWMATEQRLAQGT